MSNVKKDATHKRAMNNWSIIHAHLQNSPMMKPGQLEERLRGQMSRTDLYNFLNVYEKEGLIIRPSGKIILIKKQSLWAKISDVLTHRNKAKRYEKEMKRYRRSINMCEMLEVRARQIENVNPEGAARYRIMIKTQKKKYPKPKPPT